MTQDMIRNGVDYTPLADIPVPPPQENPPVALSNTGAPIIGHRRALYTDPDAMATNISKYFQSCLDNKRTPNIANLCVALGFSSRSGLDKYMQKPAFVDLVKSARTIIEGGVIQQMFDKPGTTGAGIFLLKNWYGYVDKKEVMNTNVLITLDDNALESHISRLGGSDEEVIEAEFE